MQAALASSRNAAGKQAEPVRVLCVDDDFPVVQAVRALIAGDKSLAWVGSLNTANDVVEVCRGDCPDIVLLDIEMPGKDAFEAMRALSDLCPAPRVIVLSGHSDEGRIFRAIQHRAWGFVDKADAPQSIIEAIRTVVGGHTYLSPSLRRFA
jgi:NarL family two-component system response regulator LiaR